MNIRAFGKVALAFWVAGMSGVSVTHAAEARPAPVSLGDATYRITRGADSKLARDATPFVYRAKEDAEKFCASLGKEMKVVSIDEQKGSLILGRFAEATLVFKALDPGDPELAGDPAGKVSRRATATAVDQASQDLELLTDLHTRGVLTDAEFEAARNRLARRATAK